jgi:hypothetical protein
MQKNSATKCTGSHGRTAKRSIEAVRHRASGNEPERPEVYFIWDRDDNLTGENLPLMQGFFKTYH